jgi:hypothetical protein
MTKSKNFIITINNPTYDIHQLLDKLKAAGFTYARAQLECGESGTKHIQACFGGKSTRFSVITKMFPGCHVEGSKSPFDAWEYCGKEDTRVEGPVEYGVPPAARYRPGDYKKRNAMLLEKGVVQAVKDGDIPIIQLPKLKLAVDLFNSLNSKPADLTALDNYWLYGAPGTGKSRGARARWPGLYNKPLNKWWCDYEQQETVLLDDFSKEHKVLGPHLKNWADHYPFVAETKGGGQTIRPTRIVITSNYEPEEIFEDKVTCEAIRRRFKFEHYSKFNF